MKSCFNCKYKTGDIVIDGCKRYVATGHFCGTDRLNWEQEDETQEQKVNISQEQKQANVSQEQKPSITKQVKLLHFIVNIYEAGVNDTLKVYKNNEVLSTEQLQEKMRDFLQEIEKIILDK